MSDKKKAGAAGEGDYGFVEDIFPGVGGGSGDEGGGSGNKNPNRKNEVEEKHAPEDDDLNSPPPTANAPRAGILDQLGDEDDEEEIVRPRRGQRSSQPLPSASAVLDDFSDKDEEEAVSSRRKDKGGSSKRHKAGTPDSVGKSGGKKGAGKRRKLEDDDDVEAEMSAIIAAGSDDDAFIDDRGAKRTREDEDDVIQTEGGLGIGKDIEDDEEEAAPKKPLNPFEEALQSHKAMRRPRKKELDPEKVEKDSIDFLERMMVARDEDVRAYKRGSPALGKLKMLREVELMTMKVQYRDSLIGSGLLPIFKAWLDPMPDGALPNVQIRTSLLNILSNIPVDDGWVDKLKNSQGLGKVVHFLAKNDDHRPNQRVAEKLMEKWARPVYQSNDDFRDILVEFDRPEAGMRAPKEGIVKSRREARETVKHFRTQREKIDEFNNARGEAKEQVMAQVPRPAPFLYTALAEGTAQVDQKVVKENRAARATNRKVTRTLSTMRRLNKNRVARAAKPSVNGR